ncbi:uncharacterized protein LOC125231795 [Leguminivora glycinivorella]|uniref:uncharacterized protein LOC125231795 n=1 Tax=Leguminivora glycinivorella TaxID=1035111 RepID=UPI00200C19E0|nr:uncharacterized protein LOC125231795 [Leguminivora glycinivorella]
MGFLRNIREFTCIVLLVLKFTGAVEYSEKNEGYAQGFLPICPGYSKPAEIKPEHLHKIKISVLSRGSLLQANWTSFNYHNVKALARDPNVDFRKKTIVYCPGYLDSTAIPLGRSMMVLYKKLGYNVLILEFIDFTTDVLPVVVRLMRPVGKHVAEMLAKLTTVGLDPKNLELVGLSLGGISMAYTAKNFKN